MAGPVIASRVYPTCALKVQTSGKPEVWCHPRLAIKKDVDARHKAGHDGKGSEFNLTVQDEWPRSPPVLS
jgi:hypothetical protein